MDLGLGLSVARQSRSGFSANQITGQKLWLSADYQTYQESTFTTAANANDHPVGGWRDRSGVNDVIQATAASRPLLKTGVQNGLPCLLCDGSNDALGKASVAHGIGAGDFWIVAAIKAGASAAYKGVLSLSGNGSGADTFYMHAGRVNWYVGGDHLFDTTGIVDAFHIFEIMRVSGTVKAYIDGVQEATTFGLGASIADGALSVGGDGVAGSSSHNGHLGDVLLYAGSPSASQRASLINQLGARWGVAVTP